jgi:energy-coupling factor transport system ATP-binding protein
MDVQIMNLTLDHACAVRDQWSLAASGTFNEGVHLVSGDVGSGKSTLALMLAGLFPLSGGSIRRTGISSCMLSLQFPELHVTGRTVAEECASWNIPADGILPAVGLTARKYSSPFTLSRGELKRLHLACVLAKDYDLLLLDEPFSSLDCQEKAKVCAVLERKSHGITVLFTHEQSILPRVDRIWEIADGKLADCGSPPDAFVHWHHVPPSLQRLIALGSRPGNISLKDIQEAACRTRE